MKPKEMSQLMQRSRSNIIKYHFDQNMQTLFTTGDSRTTQGGSRLFLLALSSSLHDFATATTGGQSTAAATTGHLKVGSNRVVEVPSCDDGPIRAVTSNHASKADSIATTKIRHRRDGPAIVLSPKRICFVDVILSNSFSYYKG